MGGNLILSKRRIQQNSVFSCVLSIVLWVVGRLERGKWLLKRERRQYLEILKSLVNAEILGFSWFLAILQASEMRLSISLDDFGIVGESKWEKLKKLGERVGSTYTGSVWGEEGYVYKDFFKVIK